MQLMVGLKRLKLTKKKLLNLSQGPGSKLLFGVNGSRRDQLGDVLGGCGSGKLRKCGEKILENGEKITEKKAVGEIGWT